ncbi:uncharacterized protein PAC_16699 [Phialocephala subalpina]|uniref:Uncharacterized protein n=1 Tax=Phialocephala subalpina TaxID=576137 RepID=A0A1L7XP52_9HELO|nr:uncharacterized protein PAC_16699 [Phialocephala subalpina]
MATYSNAVSVATFTALGTIIGYLGAEIAYKFGTAGLWKGYCRGDMLGTAFYEDSGKHYLVRLGKDVGQQKAARSGFWINTLDLVDWRLGDKGSVLPRIKGDDEASGKAVEKVRARRPVFVLTLSRHTSWVCRNSGGAVGGDIGGIKCRYFIGLIVSETITLTVGIAVAIVWHSYFSLWFLAPLLVKILALVFEVNRESIGLEDKAPDPPKQDETRGKEEEIPALIEAFCICETTDIRNGFFLIKGPSQLVLQFFRHYGHPERYRKGIRGDRVREISSMIIVIFAAMIYPSGLIAFIFASQQIQWMWLGYQLYTILSMHLYRFCGGKWIGTTERWIAKELENGKAVCFGDVNGHKVIAQLETIGIVEKVVDGRKIINQWLANLHPS